MPLRPAVRDVDRRLGCRGHLHITFISSRRYHASIRNAFRQTGNRDAQFTAGQCQQPDFARRRVEYREAGLSGQQPNQPSSSTGASTNEVGSKLIVGPNIKLKGVEITDCDTLVVEGRVEATMDSRVIQIAEIGAFKGSAEIDIAEIRGEFDGELTVREKLVIYSTGKVSGKIRYGRVVIEEGGQLTGDVQVGGARRRRSRKWWLRKK